MENGDGPATKRRRLDSEPSKANLTSSRLFAPFRTVGLVSLTNVPFTSIPLGTTTFQISTSVGRSLQTYDVKRGLNLVFLSRPQCPDIITATRAYKDVVFAAWGGSSPAQQHGVWVFKRGKAVAELDCADTVSQQIKQIVVFGNWIVACGSQAIEVWNSSSFEHYTTIRARGRDSFTHNLCTMPTYLNKIFVGCKNGSIEIYNVSTGKLVHTIHAPSVNAGNVTAITPASALGILAVAYRDGSLNLLDADTDEVVLSVRDKSSKPITSVTFRTDGLGAGEDGRKDGVMATASLYGGDVTMWDLNRGGRVTGVLRGAHEILQTGTGSGITGIEFLPGQPVLVSSGLDNALRTWIFDQTPFSAVPRPLHSRSGHAAPVTKLNFLPAASDGSEATGKWLLSAGQDHSLWAFSLRKDGQNAELSQGNVKSKAKKKGYLANDLSSVEDFKVPPIIDLACSLNRDGGMGAIGGPVWTNSRDASAEEASMTGWESIVTAHANDRFARTWFWGRRKAGRWVFESGDKKDVVSVAITTCGTFAVIGSAGGSIDMFNLQSGMHRQKFPPRLKPAQLKELQIAAETSPSAFDAYRGHKDVITGIVVDQLNRTMVSSSLDGTLIFWEFSSGRILDRLNLDSSAATAMRYNPVSGLVALSCDDLCIRVLDVETRRIVRELWGCVGQINSFCFSHDGHWIVACSMDSVVRVFDLATGHLIDAFKTATCTNVAFSSTGEYLATTHAGALGINIWNNKSLFSYIPVRQIEARTGVIDLTGAEQFEPSNLIIQEDTDKSDDPSAYLPDGVNETDQLDSSLLTLSLVPRARWQTLLNLDVVRQRNKPTQPPEKPKAAPFFLGSSLALSQGPTGNTDSLTELLPNAPGQQVSRISKLASLQANGVDSSQVSNLLSSFSGNTANHQSVEDLSNYLAALAPSAADLELRSLTPSEMPLFVRAMTSRLRQRKDFELVNTWMNVFLRLHGDFITAGTEEEGGGIDGLMEAVVDWRDVMKLEEKRLDSLVGYTRGVVEFLRSAR